MRIFISETDRINAKRTALLSIANFFNIQNLESKSNEVLLLELDAIKNKQVIDIVKLIKIYFKAYDDWFLFYKDPKKNEEYILSEPELLKLSELIKNREVSLNSLQEKFDELQLEKFNRKTFRKKIPGIIKHS